VAVLFLKNKLQAKIPVLNAMDLLQGSAKIKLNIYLI
jgi:hypothetical protein